jgi:hypothetical protein
MLARVRSRTPSSPVREREGERERARERGRGREREREREREGERERERERRRIWLLNLINNHMAKKDMRGALAPFSYLV